MGNTKQILLKYCAISIWAVTVNAGVAPFINPCKGTDSECIVKSAQAAIPIVTVGLPELGVISVEPLKIDEIIADNKDLKLKFSDVTVTGHSKCQVANAERNLDTKTLLFEVDCPIKIVGDYTASGKLLVLPVEGNDKFEINAENIRLSLTVQLETVVGADGKKHWNIASWKHTYEPLEKVHIDLKNLFNGNKKLSDPVTVLLTENWKTVALQVGPPIVKDILTKVVNVTNHLFSVVPEDELEIY